MGAPTPAPAAPAPVAQAPKPAPAPSYSGTVVIAVFSDIMSQIATGDSAPKNSSAAIAWDKIEASLKRVEGVQSATWDATSRRISISYAGPFSSIDKLRTSVQTSGASSELVSPARVVLRPMGAVEDDSKCLSALGGMSGVQSIVKDYNDFVLFADLASVDLDSIVTTAQGAGVKGMIVSHELIKVALTPGSGNSASLMDELSKTKWVLKAEIDSAANQLEVLAVKGRVTRAVVKSILSKCGFPESK